MKHEVSWLWWLVGIAGISGIYNRHHYDLGHFKYSPYNEDTKRSAYHIQSLEVFRLSQISNKIDLMMSHDWPNNVCFFGDLETLLEEK
jgi:lariat debranching enzyme